VIIPMVKKRNGYYLVYVGFNSVVYATDAEAYAFAHKLARLAKDEDEALAMMFAEWAKKSIKDVYDD
jgi:hypothetical protein